MLLSSHPCRRPPNECEKESLYDRVKIWFRYVKQIVECIHKLVLAGRYCNRLAQWFPFFFYFHVLHLDVKLHSFLNIAIFQCLFF